MFVYVCDGEREREREREREERERERETKRVSVHVFTSFYMFACVRTSCAYACTFVQCIIPQTTFVSISKSHMLSGIN